MATWVFYFETGRATFLIQFQPGFWTKDHSVNNSEESVNQNKSYRLIKRV